MKLDITIDGCDIYISIPKDMPESKLRLTIQKIKKLITQK